MALETHVKRAHPVILGLLTLFALIEIAISGYLTGRFNSRGDYSSTTERDRVRYVLFASIWTFVLSPVFLGFFMRMPGSIVSSVGAHVVFLGLSWVIWTAAAAAVTEMLAGGLDCGAQDTFAYCGQLNALEAFAWIIWILLTIFFVFILVRGVSSARRGDGFKGTIV